MFGILVVSVKLFFQLVWDSSCGFKVLKVRRESVETAFELLRTTNAYPARLAAGTEAVVPTKLYCWAEMDQACADITVQAQSVIWNKSTITAIGISKRQQTERQIKNHLQSE